jgi:hypothetical protein
MYSPGIVPNAANSIPGFLENELHRVAEAMNGAVPFAQIEMSYAAPAKLRDGMIVLADGTSWNPGSGGGFYGYRAGAWRFLG